MADSNITTLPVTRRARTLARRYAEATGLKQYVAASALIERGSKTLLPVEDKGKGRAAK